MGLGDAWRASEPVKNEFILTIFSNAKARLLDPIPECKLFSIFSMAWLAWFCDDFFVRAGKRMVAFGWGREELFLADCFGFFEDALA